MSAGAPVQLPAGCFDAVDSHEDAPDPIEDEHHDVCECSAYATTRQMSSYRFPLLSLLEIR